MPAVSIHAPARGATGDVKNPIAIGKFQSTLPQGERPKSYDNSSFTFVVSIHAPARGATKALTDEVTNKKVSIHAPARGATTCRVRYRLYLRRFQSTLPQGERLSSVSDSMDKLGFNPRSRKGSDSSFPKGFLQYKKFQSTLPQGERQ